MVGPTAELRKLADMVGKDPQAALDTATTRLAGLDQGRSNRRRIAWLHAIQADAYDNLSLPNAARAAALKGMAVLPEIQEPAHVEALSEYAFTGFDAAQIADSIPLIERARKAQRAGSAAAICLQITLGHLLRMADQSDRAIINLMGAYRASMRPGLEEQHIAAAGALSILMRYARDYDQALALNQEALDWSAARNRPHDLADFHFKGGWILVKQEQYEAALEQFGLARGLRKPFTDVVNGAYVDLLTCEALLRLGRLDRAHATCIDAERVFTAHDDASRGQARLLLAQIALAQHRPQLALDLLSSLLREGDAQSASVNRARVFQYSAQALAALGRAGEAYADLERYVTLSARWNQTEGARQAAILRARFETDRQVDRNRELQAALRSAHDREQEQRRRTLLLLIAGCAFLLLLSYIVAAERRNRRQLLHVASSDGLTGLLNRRWTQDRALAILGHAPREGHPLSVALLDLDHFKLINDTHGHAAGDEVLRQFAAAARTIARPGDILGRWGGEEFLLIMPDTPVAGALAALDRLRPLAAALRLPFGEDIRIRFSAGIASRTSERTLEVLVARADQALYRAKARGRDRTCVDIPEWQDTPPGRDEADAAVDPAGSDYPLPTAVTG